MQRYLYRLMTDQAHGFLASIIKFLLKALSLVYALAVTSSAKISQTSWLRTSLGKPVISVGNITWGGVGKTPLVSYIAEYLRKKNILSVILMRGYQADLTGKNDEAFMLQTALPQVPVVVDKNRARGARQALLNHKTDIFLLDDGFQQWRIEKDLEIVAIDATNPFGNGSLLPRGILREPLSVLSRADIFVITKSDLGNDNLTKIREQLAKINPKAPVAEAVHRPLTVEDVHDKKNVAPAWLKDREVCIVSSIGDPKSFEKMAVSLGARIKKIFVFPDHHHYKQADIQNIRDYCHQENIRYILTTAKDESKLKFFPELWLNKGQIGNLQVLILKITLTLVKGQDELARRIDHLLLR